MTEVGGSAVVRGAGVVSPAGSSLDDVWSTVLAARGTAAEVITFEAAGDLQVLGCRASGFAPETRLVRHEMRRLDRIHQMAFWAADDALEQAGPSPEPDRCAIVVGLGIGAAEFTERQYRALADRGFRSVSPLTIPVVMSNSVAAHLSMRTGWTGPVATLSSACASGAVAIGEALWLLRTGRADRVLAGGVDALFTSAAAAFFARMEAMSGRLDDPEGSSRPFDIGRDGFVLGEGAGFVVLEREGDADGPGLGSVIGYGTTSDAENIVAPAEDGVGAARCMRQALADADVTGDQVGHINAHGTSTLLNDATEGIAIRAVFGDHRVPVTSSKSVFGHLIGAAGAVEAIVALQAARAGLVPPIANLETPDPDIDLDLVTTAEPLARPVVLSNSFGFGGHNASLVIR